jgi:trehalose-phosphatase
MTLPSPRPRIELPSALQAFDRFLSDTGSRRPSVFLDYDGVLTPIVARPDLAIMSAATRAVLEDLASRTEVAIISGRDTADVRERVGLDGVWYAGSHGFDIVGPDGAPADGASLGAFERYVPALKAATDRIETEVAGMPGVLVEPKRFAVAVHFREAEDGAESVIARLVREIGAADDRLVVTTGKKIYELRPAVEWDKGRALEWLIQRLEIDLETSIPIYLGDDVTDEDAFAALIGTGIGIIVGRDGEPSRASYALENPDEVRTLLASLGGQIGP